MWGVFQYYIIFLELEMLKLWEPEEKQPQNNSPKKLNNKKLHTKKHSSVYNMYNYYTVYNCIIKKPMSDVY